MTGKNYFLVVYRVLILILYKVQKSTHTKKRDVRQMYKDCGYKSLDKMSDQKVWEIYKRQVGYIARQLIK